MPTPPLIVRSNIADQNLGVRFDDLNKAIIEAESYLRSLKPVDSTWITYAVSNYPDGSQTWSELGICKYGGTKWTLCYGSGSSYEEGVSINALIECPILTRVAAIKHLPELEEQIIKSKEKFVAEVDNAIVFLKRFAQQN